MQEQFMREAIALAIENVRRGGGPFAAVIVKGGKVIARGANRVTASKDPTAHAEIEAIRAACRAAGDFHLTGCELYTSSEPCPMCLGAIYWARIDRYYYGNTRQQAAGIGFDDSRIYQELGSLPGARSIPARRLLADEAAAALAEWMHYPARVPY
jgi:guanine deaminase